MFDYTGYECKCCGKKFTEQDDIVVCPDCGTPYHRECYKSAGKCINTELHENGRSWKAVNEKAPEPELKCRFCGNKLRDDQLFCDNCGHYTEYYTKVNGAGTVNNSGYTPVSSTTPEQRQGSTPAAENMYPFLINYSDPLCGFNPDETYENGLTTKDIGDFVETNTHYYLPKFRNMKHFKLKLSLNFPAMIFPELYFANRKMPFAALFVLIFKAIIGLPQMVVSMQNLFLDENYRKMYMQLFPYVSAYIEKITAMNLSDSKFTLLFNISYMLEIASIFFFAGFSNYLYYRHVITAADIVKTSAAAAGQNVSFELKKAGGTSSVLLITFLVMYFAVQLLSVAVVFYFI